MAYYVLICSGGGVTGASLGARQTFEKLLLLLLTERFWPHASSDLDGQGLQPGDRVLFCLATVHAPEIVGQAVVAAPSTPLTEQQRAEIRIYLGPAMPPDLQTLSHAVSLEQIAVWHEPWRPASEDDAAAFELSRALAGIYQTGSVRAISRETFEHIVGEGQPAKSSSAPEPTPPPRQTAASAITEQVRDGEAAAFLLRHWDLVDFGENLRLLHTSRRGQLAADPVDFLCEARDSGDLVAIACVEKATPGEQVAAFRERLSWLRDHAARPGQRVRGMLLALDPEFTLNGAGGEVEVRYLKMSCPPAATDRDDAALAAQADVPRARRPDRAIPGDATSVDAQTARQRTVPSRSALSISREDVPPDFAEKCMRVPRSRRSRTRRD